MPAGKSGGSHTLKGESVTGGYHSLNTDTLTPNNYIYVYVICIVMITMSKCPIGHHSMCIRGTHASGDECHTLKVKSMRTIGKPHEGVEQLPVSDRVCLWGLISHKSAA